VRPLHLTKQDFRTGSNYSEILHFIYNIKKTYIKHITISKCAKQATVHVFNGGSCNSYYKIGTTDNTGLNQKVSADRDLKSKTYESEDGSVVRTIGCTKDNEGCKNFNEGFGDNINKAAKEFCESDSGQKCKQSKQ